jgi:hypothetical protein
VNPRRDEAAAAFAKLNAFVACLMHTQLRPFAEYDIFAVATMRSALETPLEPAEVDENVPSAFIPAAAEWIFNLGAETYKWDREFPHGFPRGYPGVAGALWEGRPMSDHHGPCKARWQFWRKRFEELSADDRVPREFQDIARRAESRMGEIETGST